MTTGEQDFMLPRQRTDLQNTHHAGVRSTCNSPKLKAVTAQSSLLLLPFQQHCPHIQDPTFLLQVHPTVVPHSAETKCRKRSQYETLAEFPSGGQRGWTLGNSRAKAGEDRCQRPLYTGSHIAGSQVTASAELVTAKWGWSWASQGLTKASSTKSPPLPGGQTNAEPTGEQNSSLTYD